MFSLLSSYKNMIVAIVIVTLAIGLYFYIHSLNSQISTLRFELKDIQIELANKKLEGQRCKSAVDEQSLKIELLKVDKKTALSKLEKWKALPPKIKYKTITKIREVKSDDCEDLKAQLDAIKHLDFNSL